MLSTAKIVFLHVTKHGDKIFKKVKNIMKDFLFLPQQLSS